MKFKKIIPILLLILANVAVSFKLISPAKVQMPIQTLPSVEIRPSSDGNLAALVRNHPSFPNTVFILQTSVQSTGTPVIIANATIIYAESSVTFTSQTNGQNYIFKLTSSNTPTPTGNIGVKSGYGLARVQDPNTYNLYTVVTGTGPFPPPQEATCTCYPSTWTGSCDSGGAGSTDCSVSVTVGPVTSECSVSCATGYTACCNNI